MRKILRKIPKPIAMALIFILCGWWFVLANVVWLVAQLFMGISHFMLMHPNTAKQCFKDAITFTVTYNASDI